MRPDPTGAPRFMSVRTRAALSAVVGIVAAVAVVACGLWQLAPLVGWDVTAAVFISWVLVTILPMRGPETAALAIWEDPGRAVADGLLLLAGVASLLAVGVLMLQAGNAEGLAKASQAGLGVVSVVLSWGLVHTIFTLRYARLYYTAPVGGVDFNDDDPPSYLDFAYLALTIGMTFQVSDTNLSGRVVRAAALRHALLSYLFSTVIVATTISLVVGLST
jgi:uncharacterized membrane protein